jgi:Transglycosylase SLT domain
MRPPLLARAEINFLQAYVLFMFLLESSPVWSLVMIGRQLVSLTVLALCAARPACAQEIEGTGPSGDPASSIANATSNPGAGSEGVRVTATSTFTLQEHGVWHKVGLPGASETAAPLNAPTPRLKIAARPPLRTAQSSFRRLTWLPWINAAENRHRLPLGLLDALIWTESRYNSMAISSAGAVGLAQLMPGTARDLGVANRYDPVASIDGGARYLKQMLDRFGSIHLAVAAYNAGPNAVTRAKGIPLNGETPGYVRNVLTRWGLF